MNIAFGTVALESFVILLGCFIVHTVLSTSNHWWGWLARFTNVLVIKLAVRHLGLGHVFKQLSQTKKDPP